MQKIIHHLGLFSSITTESIYVLDIPQKRFCYIQPNSLFLCGFSVEDILKQGYDFYSKIVYPGDLSLWVDMGKAVLRYLKDAYKDRAEIDFFSCTFRLQCNYSFLPRPLPQMIFHRMKPVWEGDDLRYLICTLGRSAVKEVGGLRIYKKDVSTYEVYNFKTKRWELKTIELLTECEKAILMLAGQGKSAGEIANDLCKGLNTIRNQIKVLFAKLKVHSMQEAIEFSHIHSLVYPKQDIGPQPIEVSRKRSRVLLTEDMLLRIQQYLADGKSIRQAARLEGVSESAIRYWKDKARFGK